jgi:hypothetical protein
MQTDLSGDVRERILREETYRTTVKQQLEAKETKKEWWRDHWPTFFVGFSLLVFQTGFACWLDGRRSEADYEREVARSRTASLQELWSSVVLYREQLDKLLDERGDPEQLFQSSKAMDETLRRCGVFVGLARVGRIKARLGLPAFLGRTTGKRSKEDLGAMRGELLASSEAVLAELEGLFHDSSSR